MVGGREWGGWWHSTIDLDVMGGEVVGWSSTRNRDLCVVGGVSGGGGGIVLETWM